MTISRVSITKIITDVEGGGMSGWKEKLSGAINMFYILFGVVVAQMCIFFCNSLECTSKI